MSGDDKPPRRLSDDDEMLWHTVTRSIVPLKRRRARRSEPEGVRASAKLQGNKLQGKLSVKPAPKSPSLPRTQAGPGPKVPPPLMPIDRKLKQRLARGQIEIDGRIDLHGRTLSEAHAALL